MKNSIMKKVSMFLALPLVAVATWAGVASAQSTGVTGPFFNIHDNTDVGDESDFLRIRKTDGTKVNTIEACEGELSLWFYVHNGQSAVNNGTNNDGTGVATNTRISVRPLPTTFGKSHTLTGKITADNADAVTDNATITCGSEDIKVEYQSIEQLYRYNPGMTTGYSLTGDITSQQGALLGFDGGKVPGCWDFRAIVLVKVKIVKKPAEPVVVKKCVPGQVVFVDRTKRDINVSAEVQNANVTKYIATIKDKSGKVVATKEEATSAKSYTYRFDQPTGEYTVSVKVVTDKGDADNTCEFTIKVEEEPKGPFYQCENFVLSFSNRKVVAKFKPVSGNGATFKNASVNFNDGANSVITTDKVGTDGNVVAEYTYPGTGALNKEVVATVRFMVNGEEKTVDCKAKAEVKGVTTVTTLYKAGPADTLAVAMIVAIAGTVAHRKYTLVKNGR